VGTTTQDDVEKAILSLRNALDHLR
jgi:hypothetical protein